MKSGEQELMIHGKAVIFEEWDYGFTVLVKTAMRSILFEWTPEQGTSRKMLGRVLRVLNDSKGEIPEYVLASTDQLFKIGILGWRKRMKDGKKPAELAEEREFKLLYSTLRNFIARTMKKTKAEPKLSPDEQQRRLSAFTAKFAKGGRRM